VFNTLVEKVARHAFRVTDEDVAAARSAGLREDQVFELVVCAAVGEAHRQHEAALAALDAASAKA
jgi:alkylhydroperoxidase family enzyme